MFLYGVVNLLKTMKTETIELEPKEKAKQLLDTFKFADIYFIGGNETMLQNAKNCALLCVNELLDTVPFINNTPTQIKKRMYYMDVREEIRKL